jgi:hypothetical protein
MVGPSHQFLKFFNRLNIWNLVDFLHSKDVE